LQVQNNGRKLAEHFVGLKPPEKKEELDILLEDSDEEADEKDSALKGQLKLKESKMLKNTGVKMTSMLKFHSYENVLMVCDEQDGISIWDYEKGNCNVHYKNGNGHQKGSRMTSACWINEQTRSLFFVGCNDGSARFWSNIIADDGHISTGYPTLSAAFTAVPDLQTGERGSGMICEWQQFSGSLIAGGHSKYLRCWDLSTEKCSLSLETDTTAAVTAMATAWDEDLGLNQGGYSGMGPDVVIAGHSDGSLKLFDTRSRNAVDYISNRPRRHTKFTEHRSWIVDVSFSSYGGRHEVVSGSISGDIRAWDLRMSNSLRTLEAQRSPMTALAVHKQIPIAATGSHAQFIKILTLDGEALQVIRFHEESASHRIGPVSCLEFHRQKLLLAAGATNSFVSIYSPKHSFT
jgi:regulator-associated protein of mTOR